jgi:two-component system, NtrC family, sensor kinase
LQQQTATADVLKLISRSTFDLQPVLDMLVETAARLCDADAGSIWRQDGQTFRAAGVCGFPEDVTQLIRESRLTPGRGTVTARTVLEGRPVHIVDVRQDVEYTWSEIVERAGLRAMLGVPLIREGKPIGAFSLHRMEPRPFTDQQVELVTTFADQAVIAMENARLLSELRQSLEQQTATAEVLDVISRSAFDLRAVFEAVVESSVKLCEAERGFIYRFDGELLRMAVGYNVSGKLRDFVEQNPLRPGRHSAAARAALERKTIHIPDVLADPEYTYGSKDVGEFRTVLAAPILKGEDLLGVLVIHPQNEVRPFTETQIA